MEPTAPKVVSDGKDTIGTPETKVERHPPPRTIGATVERLLSPRLERLLNLLALLCLAMAIFAGGYVTGRVRC